VPQGLERSAQELVHEAGSVRGAKKAIDTAAKMEDGSDFREDQLALLWGFKSRKQLLAASKPIDDGTGDSWWATRLSNGFWRVWNQDTVKSDNHATLDEAKQSLPDPKASDKPAHSTSFPEGFNG
jgi:hypothetical protein